MNDHSFDFMFHFNEQDGSTALMTAASNGHQECISVLIANGAEVNMANEVNSMELISI